MLSISVIGAGWLGMTLAECLLNKGHQVVGSHRNLTPQRGVSHPKQLQNANWSDCAYQLGEALPEQLANNDVAIINIPLKRSASNSSEHVSLFVTQIKQLIQQLKDHGTKHILLVSTTSVYGNQTGIVLESNACAPSTGSGAAHVEIEQFLHQLMLTQATTIRLAGLIGGNRHPANSLSGKQDIGHPNQVVNLIHRDDAVAAICAIIDNKIWGETFHLAAIEHPKRCDYYTWAAKQLDLPLPKFAEEKSQQAHGKLIDSTHTLNRLGLTLNHPSPYSMLESNK